jgi:hypothetical protein
MLLYKVKIEKIFFYYTVEALAKIFSMKHTKIIALRNKIGPVPGNIDFPFIYNAK